MISFLTPPTVHTPLSAYSHTAVLPAGAETVLLSGQVGLRPDGSLPASFAEQCEQVFDNIGALLAAHGLDASAIAKLTVFIVDGEDIAPLREARGRFLGEHRPASTAVFVPRLVDPRYRVEVEAIAVRATG